MHRIFFFEFGVKIFQLPKGLLCTLQGMIETVFKVQSILAYQAPLIQFLSNSANFSREAGSLISAKIYVFAKKLKSPNQKQCTNYK